MYFTLEKKNFFRITFKGIFSDSNFMGKNQEKLASNKLRECLVILMLILKMFINNIKKDWI